MNDSAKEPTICACGGNLTGFKTYSETIANDDGRPFVRVTEHDIAECVNRFHRYGTIDLPRPRLAAEARAELTTLRTRSEKMERALREIETSALDFGTCEEADPMLCDEAHEPWAEIAAIAREALEKGE